MNVNYCVVPYCPKPVGLMCYSIPLDYSRRQKWLAQINSGSEIAIINQNDAAVCSLHFRQSDYLNLDFCEEKSYKKLTSIAVPSIFPWTSDWNAHNTQMKILWNGNIKSSKIDVFSSASPLCSVESKGLAPHFIDEQTQQLSDSSAVNSNGSVSENLETVSMSDVPPFQEFLSSSTTSLDATNSSFNTVNNWIHSFSNPSTSKYSVKETPEKCLKCCKSQETSPGTSVKISSKTEIPELKIESQRKSIETGNDSKLIKRLVYECPHCSFLMRSVSDFHQHVVAHEKTPMFKCSNCDYYARYRWEIIQHIEESLKITHESASWTMAKSIPEDRYEKLLKIALVPDISSCSTPETSLVLDGCSSKTGSNTQSILKNHETRPKSPLPKLVVKEEPISPSITDNVKHRSAKTRSSKRKKMCIDLDEDVHNPDKEEESETCSKGEEAISEMLDQFDMTRKFFGSVVDSSLVKNAEMKRLKDEETISQQQKKVDLLQRNLGALEEADTFREMKLLQYMERKRALENRVKLFVGQKTEIETLMRVQQCEILKLKLASTSKEAEQSLENCRGRVATLECHHEDIEKSISKLKMKHLNVDQKIMEEEQIRVAAAQLLEINKSDLNQANSDLLASQEAFTTAVLKIRKKEKEWLSALDCYVRTSLHTVQTEKSEQTDANQQMNKVPVVMTSTPLPGGQRLGKKMRIHSDEGIGLHFKVKTEEISEIQDECEKGRLIDHQKALDKLELLDKPEFPFFKEALFQRQQDDKRISEKINEIKTLQAKLTAMKESNVRFQLETSQMNEDQRLVLRNLRKLNDQNSETELEMRKQQCEELKLVFANPSEAVKQSSKIVKRRITNLDAKLEEINKKITSLSMENQILNQRIQEADQLNIKLLDVESVYSSQLAFAETELHVIYENLLTGSNLNVKHLVEKERKSIKERFASLVEELQVSYTKVISQIRQKEQLWFSLLDQFVEENFGTPLTPNI